MKLFAMIEEIRTVEFERTSEDASFCRRIFRPTMAPRWVMYYTQAKGDIESLLGLIPGRRLLRICCTRRYWKPPKELGLNQAQPGGTAGLISEVFDQKLPKDTAKELEEALQEAVDGYSGPTVGFLYKSGTRRWHL